MQIKITRHYFTHTRWAHILKLDNIQMLTRILSNRNSFSLLARLQIGSTLENNFALPKRFEQIHTLQRSNSAPGMYFRAVVPRPAASVSWELVRNANSPAARLPEPETLGLGPSNLGFSKPFRWLMHIQVWEMFAHMDTRRHEQPCSRQHFREITDWKLMSFNSGKDNYFLSENSEKKWTTIVTLIGMVSMYHKRKIEWQKHVTGHICSTISLSKGQKQVTQQ